MGGFEMVRFRAGMRRIPTLCSRLGLAANRRVTSIAHRNPSLTVTQPRGVKKCLFFYASTWETYYVGYLNACFKTIDEISAIN